MARKQHGVPGHFIAANRCCFRIHTSVNGRYRISTIGCYHPLSDERMERDPVEVGSGRLFETFVFALGEDGLPSDWSEVDAKGSRDEHEAEAAHESMCQKYEAL